MQAVDEEFEVKQAKDMAAARKRWEALVFFIYFIILNFFIFCYSHYN